MKLDLFKKTKLKLSCWYLAILIAVAMIFNLIVYSSLNAELLRSARREQQKIMAQNSGINLPKPLPDPPFLPKEFEEPTLTGSIKSDYLSAKNKLIYQIILANLLLLGLSAAASYWLAGQTLKPIENMVNEQKKFISSASHELRTPLTALKTAIEVTLKMGALPYEKMKDLLLSNLEDVEHLEKLSNDLLSFEKQTYKEENLIKLVNIELSAVMQATIDKFRPMASQFGIKIEFKKTSAQILGDQDSLKELFDIVIENAIKYNKVNGKIIVAIKKKHRRVFVEIKDTGIGINQEDLPRIFEQFYRADQLKLCLIPAGHGLGLAIASQIMTNHQGQIIATSQIGSGTTMTLEFPLH